MAELFDLDPVADNNVTRWPENMLAASVNNSAREDEAMLARDFRDRMPYASTSGTLTAYTLTAARTIATLTTTTRQSFRAHTTCGAAPTFNLSGLGAYPIRKNFNAALAAGDIAAGQVVDLAWDATNTAWQMLTPTATTNSNSAFGLRVGNVILSVDASPASGFVRLKETAQALLKTDYPDLNTWASGQGYPWGSAATTFNVPPAGGYFLRFAAANTTVDTAGARLSGVTQADQLKTATIPSTGLTASTSVSVTATAGFVGTSTTALSGGGANAPVNPVSLSVTATAGTTIGGSTTLAGGDEVRVKNVSMHADMLANPSAVAAGLIGVGGLAYKWDTGTAAADPGSGYLRVNNVAIGSATTAYINETASNGASLAAVLQAIPANSGLYIVKVGAPQNYIAFTTSSVVSDSGTYDTVTITGGTSSGTIAQGDDVSIVIMRAGATGATGTPGVAGSDGGVKYTFDSSTTMAAPAAGGVRFNNATLASATAIAIANTTADAGNPSVSGWINAWDDSTTTGNRGQLLFRKASTGATVAIFNVTSAVTDNATWLTFSVAGSSVPGTFTNGDALLVAFSRSGDKGADGAGAGTVTSITAGGGISSSGVGATGGAITTNGTLTLVEAVNAQTGTTYTVVAADHTKLLTLSNAGSIAVALPQAIGSFAAGFYVDVANLNAGVVTVTPTTSTINGGASFVLNRFHSVRLVSDGTNWQVMQGEGLRGQSTAVASAATCDIGTTASQRISITGTTTITSLGTVPNQLRFVTFVGILTLTYNATTLLLPGAASITTAAGDAAIVSSDGSGNWTCIAYTKASGAAVVGGSGGGVPSAPQGRLTLSAGTPVIVNNVNNATIVYYTPYAGRHVPLYDGSTTFTMTDIVAELSQATTDTTKSPAACAASSNYDLFVWSDAGTIRCTRGPAWSSSTARGTGAGTTELQLINGFYVNKVAITNGPAATRGTYVGTVRTNASSQLDYSRGGIAAGGTAALLNVWNCYNRVTVTTLSGDTTDNWTYSTIAWRQANASAGMQTSLVRGLDEEPVQALYAIFQQASATGGSRLGIGVDSTIAYSGIVAGGAAGGSPTNATAIYANLPGLGSHVFAAIEYTAVASAATFYGRIGATSEFQSGLTIMTRC